MIALLALALVAEATARLSVEPATSMVGEPVVLTLVVERPAGSDAVLPEIEPGVRGSWMFLESLGVRRERSGEALVERVAWRAFALEGGAALPEIEVEVAIDGRAQRLRASGPEPAVARALLEGEDAPRPPKGFRPPLAWEGGGARLGAVALCLALLAAVALVLAIRRARRRRGDRAPAGPDPAEQLARLAPDPRDGALNRDVVFALTRIARAAVDEFAGAARAASTDREWLAAVEADARLSEAARAAARRLVERAEAIKYAGAAPTGFATEEALADARAIVAAVAGDRRAA
ncbi:MAG: hypothetical protein JNK02_14445 [Planctomycetes bacterium]|nr:hypothetical protein [Planctomycetota bacterium]